MVRRVIVEHTEHGDHAGIGFFNTKRSMWFYFLLFFFHYRITKSARQTRPVENELLSLRSNTMSSSSRARPGEQKFVGRPAEKEYLGSVGSPVRLFTVRRSLRPIQQRRQWFVRVFFFVNGKRNGKKYKKKKTCNDNNILRAAVVHGRTYIISYNILSSGHLVPTCV